MPVPGSAIPAIPAIARLAAPPPRPPRPPHTPHTAPRAMASAAAAPFAALMLSLLSNDNEERRRGEAQYRQHIEKDAAATAGSLVALLRGTDPADPNAVVLRTQAAVLLRSSILLRRKLPVPMEVLLQLREPLLGAWAAEKVGGVRRRLAHTAATLAQRLGEGGAAWPELLQAVERSLALGAEEGAAALTLLRSLCEAAAGLVTPHAAALLPTFSGALDAADAPLRSAAATASLAMLLELDAPEAQEQYARLLPKVLRSLEADLAASREAPAHGALEALTRVVEARPRALRGHLDVLGGAMLAVARSESLSDATRLLALELLVSFCESSAVAARRCAWLTAALVPLALQFLCHAHDVEPQWAMRPEPGAGGIYDAGAAAGLGLELGSGSSGEPEEEDEEEEVSDAAALALERLAMSLGGERVVEAALPHCATLLSDGASWQQRRAALTAIGLLGEPCRPELSGALEQLCAAVAHHARHPHPRVRHAALACLGRMAEDHAESGFHARCGAATLEALAAGLAEAEAPRLQTMACLALASFAQPPRCAAEHLAPAAEHLLQRLHALAFAASAVAPHALTASGAVALCLGGAFAPFYAHFAPPVLACVLQARVQDAAGRLRHGKACEALALFGQAVGPERSSPDALEALRALEPLLARGGDAEDHQHASYMLTAVARMGATLGDAFAPYLGLVVRPALSAAAQALDVRVAESADALRGQSGMAVVCAGDGGVFVGVNTFQLQRKELALQTLHRLLGECSPAAMAPFARELLPVLLDCLACGAMFGVRIVAAGALPRALRAVLASPAAAGLDPTDAFGSLAAPALLAQLRAEDGDEELEPLCIVADALSDVAKDAFEGGVALPEAVAQGIFEGCAAEARASVARRALAAEALGEEGADALALEELREREEWERDLRTSCVDSLGWVLKARRAEVAPLWEAHALPLAQELLAGAARGELPDDLLGWALCSFIDAAEHCAGTPAGLRAAHAAFGPCLELLPRAGWELRQVCAYGLGALAAAAPLPVAQASGAAPAAVWPQVLAALLATVREGHARRGGDDEWCGSCAENAAHAALKVVECAMLGGPPALKAPDEAGARAVAAKALAQCMALFPFEDDEEEGALAVARLRRWIAELPDVMNAAVEMLDEAPRRAFLAAIGCG